LASLLSSLHSFLLFLRSVPLCHTSASHGSRYSFFSLLLLFSPSFLSLSSFLFIGDSSPFSSSAAETRSLQRFLFLFFSLS
jgi:hypothetical protein